MRLQEAPWHYFTFRHARSQITGRAPARWPLSKHGQRQASVLARQGLWRAVEHIFSSPERINRCLKAMVAAHPEQTVAVVSHGLVLTLFLARLENRWPTVAEWRAIPFSGLAVVETTPWHLVTGWASISEAS